METKLGRLITGDAFTLNGERYQVLRHGWRKTWVQQTSGLLKGAGYRLKNSTIVSSW